MNKTVEVNYYTLCYLPLRYRYLCVDVQEYLHPFLKAGHPYCPAAADVCSDLLHDLQTIPQSIC